MHRVILFYSLIVFGINLVIANGGLLVFVKEGDKAPFGIELNRDSIVNDIRVALLSIYDNDELYYKLKYAGKELKNDQSLADCGVSNEAIIDMNIIHENFDNIRFLWRPQSLSKTYLIKIVNKLREFQGKSACVKLSLLQLFICKDQNNVYECSEPRLGDIIFQYVANSYQFINWKS